MTVTQFCSLSNLSVAQVRALREAGLIPPDLPPDQAGRARLLQRLKQKGIPLSQLARAELPPAGQYVVYDHSDRRIDAARGLDAPDTPRHAWRLQGARCKAR